MKQGWKLSDIEDADFDVLMQVLSAKQKKKEQKVSLADFVRSL